MLKIYEFYDGYEHLWTSQPEKERTRVQYVVIGEIDHLVVICYLSEHKYLSYIGCKNHARAWTIGEIAEGTVINYIKYDRDYIKYRLPHVQAEIEHAKDNKKELDSHNSLHVDHSASSSMKYFFMSVHWTHHDSYTDKLVQQLEKVVQILSIRDAFVLHKGV